VRECGDLISGEIEASGEVDTFRFEGNAGDVVDLTLVLTGGFDGFFGRVPAATVFTPSGGQLDAFNSNKQDPLTLPETGTYRVRVNANSLVHTGTYNIGLECRSPPGPIDAALTCGALVSGEIEAAGAVDFFSFQGTKDAVVDLTLVRTGGFDAFFGRVPRATVFTPTGTQLDVFDSNQQRALNLPETGTYLVRVNANSLVHTGTYNVGLQCS
jgi:hypothetical protein